MSDVYTTILTDSPTFSKNYEVEFAGCTDRDRKNYAIVKIGYQTCMALPGGSWFGNGVFFNLGCGGFFWSSKEDGNSDAWYRSIGSGGDGIYHDNLEKYSGFSVRCLRN